MNKLLALATTCALLIPNFTDARTHTIVEKDIYGSSLYASGVMSGDYLFVNTTGFRIDILDLSDTANVTLLNNLQAPCPVYDIAIDGDVLAAGCSNFIHFYNVSDAANPVSVGVYDNGGVSLDEYVFENNRLYLANDDSEIIVYDTTDTNNLIELSRVDLDSYTSIKLHKEGDFLYTVEGFDKAGIYDVSDTNNISLVSEYQDPTRQIFDVTVVDDTLYLSHAEGIQIVDITTPSSPAFVKEYLPTPDSGTFGRPWTLISENKELFLSTQQGEVVQLGLSDPHNPTDLAFHSIDTFWILEMITFNRNLLTFSAFGGLSMADFTDSDNILPLNGYNKTVFPHDIALENNRVVTTNHGSVYNFLELDDDLQFNEVNRIADFHARGAAALDGDTAWLGGIASLETYDLTNFSSPVLIDSVQTESNWANQVTEFDGDKVYLGNYDGDVFIYDVAGRFPVLVSTIRLGVDPVTNGRRSIEDIKRHGDYLLVVTPYDDLAIIDLTDEANPSELASYSWGSGNQRQIEVVGNTLYLTKSGGLFLADLTDINNPVYLGARYGYGLLRAIDIVEEGKSILVSGFNGVFFVDTTDEVNPVEVHSVDSEDYISSMAYQDGVIVAASLNDARLKSYQLNSAPMSSDSSVTAFANSTLNGQLDSSDPEGDNVSYTVDTDVTNGTLVINDDGSFDYTPNADFVGEDSFQYTAEDEHGGSSSATVSITVESGYDHVFEAMENTMFYGQVTESGLEGKEIKFKIVVQPTNGKIVFKRNGKFKYLANPGFIGEDNFEYVANNEIVISDNKAVKINVSAAD